MKKNNKGFTLVELIVVLVILAILAAILVPALLGYIDRAREKQYVLNAKSALTATQAELSAIYGEDAPSKLNTLSSRALVIAHTADVPGAFYIETTLTNTTEAKAANHAAFTITHAIYVENDYYCEFNGKSWVTTQSDPGTSSMTAIFAKDDNTK